jgi:hypothetical protein
MKKFGFDIIITAPTQKDATEKMEALNIIGKHLTLSELQTLAKTVCNPALFAIAKQKLGL